MFYHCVLLDEAMASWENFSCVFLFYESLNCFKVKWCLNNRCGYQSITQQYLKKMFNKG